MTPPLPDSALFLEVEGGVEICLPGSLAVMTTYVVLEQETWFEDELGFVRRLLRPGMNAIDIGANYGLYTLAMAKQVGAAGRVLAFEPARETCAYLRRSLDANGFANVDLRQCALSNQIGRGRLRLETRAELNQLASDGGTGEEVELDTLDHVAESLGAARIDFVKLDAEGAEVDIVAGGARFLAAHSALVMFERKHGTAVNAPLLDALRAHGLALYRLVPSLGALVPLDQPHLDSFQLNLFACRSDRAALLEQAGLLARAAAPAPRIEGDPWSRALGAKPYARAFQTAVTRPAPIDAESASFRAALLLHEAAMAPQSPPALRYAALKESLTALSALIGRAANLARLLTFVRVAAAAGARQAALRLLSQMPLDPGAYRPDMIAEPFLPACPRFDDIDPGDAFGEWCAVSVFEQLERLRAFSSYFSKSDALPYFEAFRTSRFFSPELERRRQLVRIGCSQQARLEFQPILGERGPGNLNARFWRSLAA